MRGPIELLDDALEKAQAAGAPATGWFLQHGAEGYAAWLYSDGDDDDGELEESLFPEVDCCASVELAVQALRDEVQIMICRMKDDIPIKPKEDE